MITALCFTTASAQTRLDISGKTELRVLDIGNSFTNGPLDYINIIGQCCKASKELSAITFYKAVSTGASFKTWYDIYRGTSTVAYDCMKTAPIFHDAEGVTTGISISDKGEAFRYLLEKCTWDVILIHQCSAYAGEYSSWTTQSEGGYLPEYLALIRKLQPTAKIGFILVHSSPIYSTKSNTLDVMWKNIAEATRMVVADYNLDFFVPYGTAIQNLRASMLNVGVNNFTCDDLHLGTGLASYTMACTYFESVLSNVLETHISEDKTLCDKAKVVGTRPEANVDITDDNSAIALQCAISAIEHPFEVRIRSNNGEPSTILYSDRDIYGIDGRIMHHGAHGIVIDTKSHKKCIGK